jgi:hypothetical protein
VMVLSHTVTPIPCAARPANPYTRAGRPRSLDVQALKRAGRDLGNKLAVLIEVHLG